MKLKAIILVLFAKQYAVITYGKFGNKAYNRSVTRAKSMDFLENAVKCLAGLTAEYRRKTEAAR